MTQPELEKRVLRKIDKRVLSITWFMLVLNFLDRVNVGNVLVPFQEHLQVRGATRRKNKKKKERKEKSSIRKKKFPAAS
jgi:hypothetical protein